MTTAIKRRRGTTTQHSTFTGLEGEITIDTTKDTAVVHDGATAGGRPLLREDLANNTEVVTKTGTQTLTNKTLTSPVINTPTGITKSDISLGNVDNTSDATKNAATATLTNKTITLGANTITGTVAQFQAAVTDGDFATLAGTETFTNKAFNGTLGATTPSTAVVTSLTDLGLTSGRVTYASTGGLLADSASLTYDGTTLTSTKFAGAFNGSLGATTPSTVVGTSILSTGGSATVQARLNGSDTFGGGASLGITNTAADRIWFTQLSASNNYDWWYFNGSAASKLATLNTSGNLGLGVTPSAWGSNFKAMQIGAGVGTTAIIGRTAQNNSQFGNNFYFDGTNYVYVGTGYSSRYSQVSGNHEWHIASSGTAGNAITFTQAMTLDASGNLGIGTASPSTYTTGLGTGLAIASPSNGGYLPAISLAKTGAAGGGAQTWTMYVDNTRQFTLYNFTSSADAFAVNTNGAVSLQGAVKTATGVGITFPATQSASTNANTLDDYEEGTWTVVVGDGTNNYTATFETGTYTKIGNLVTASGFISWSSIGSAGAGQLRASLPFAAVNTNYVRYSAAIGYIRNFDTVLGTKQITANLDQGVNYLTFWQTNDNADPTALPANAQGSSGGVQFAISYQV